VFATLFDFDGVLVDSEPVHLAAFNDVLKGRGITLSEKEYVERYQAYDDAGVFREVLSRRNITLDEEQVRMLVAAKAPRFMERFQSGFRAFPGAREAVLRRAARGPVGIVSGAFESEIEFALNLLGVRGSVAFIVATDHVSTSKPDPEPYRAGLAALARLGHTGGVVAIEDSLGGVASAVGAGVRCVAVSHAYTESELSHAGAVAVAASLDALDDALLEGG
jgi:beta-phosphoglucomutase-like phosphatase (HAD superfamily)